MEEYINQNKNVENLVIWSDGGRKHFKNADIQQFIMKFQKKKSILIEWNFFVSYHGFNPCDLASAQLKSKLKTEMNNKQINLDLNEIIRVCGQLPNSEAFPLVLTSFEENSEKMNGISRYHHFRYLNNKIELKADCLDILIMIQSN